jgi:prepilin-type N-terminal cleavage/methylation domain-containing protein
VKFARTLRPAGRGGNHSGDRGSTLLELVVTLSIVGVVMTSLTALYVHSTAVQRKQSDMQVAAQFAVAAMERVSLLPGSTLLVGRSQQAVVNQWRAVGVDAFVNQTTTQLAWQAPGTSAPPGVEGLPTTAEAIKVNGTPTKYQRHWYVGLCWQPRTGGDCVVVPAAQQATRVPMYRVVVAITWRSKDCGGDTCQYVSAMLTERQLEDPTF